jgi:dTDP-4-amino-4,6-dideoxygalactose transaminase
LSKIPFNIPGIVGNEYKYIKQTLDEKHISGDGMFTNKVHKLLEKQLGVEKVLLTTSCTHALEMTAILLDIKPKDEVIVPSFTFVSSVNAFVLRGAHPVFIDIRQDTLNLDETQLEKMITDKTKAIVLVHYAGVGCEMDDILPVAKQYDIPIVEDNAHGLFGKYKGKYLGTFGNFAAQSFHETKNFTSGEGGALLINDPKYIERAEIIREKGTNRSRFFRGQIDKYTWVDIGSSFLPSDILAAFLFAQLEKREMIQEKRKNLWEYYHTHLSNWANANNIKQPYIPAHCEQTYHMYYLLCPSLEIRQTLIEYLKSNNVQSVFHYLPLHLSEMGLKFGGRKGDCPITEDISDRLLRLPLYFQLSEDDQNRVIDLLRSFSV